MSESVSHCRLEPSWATECKVRLEKLGEINIKSKFNFCTSPAILDTAVRIQHQIWKSSFSPKNVRESKIVGLGHWPLRLHVNFFKDDVNARSQTVLACLEAVKSDEEFCFLNATIPDQQLVGRTQYRSAVASRYYSCDSSKSELSVASVPFFTIICLLLSIFLVTTISCIVVCRRRARQKKSRRHRRGNGVAGVPTLPQAKPYPDPDPESTNPENEELMPSIVEDSLDVDERREMKLAKNRHGVTNDSKFVQTSLTSLGTVLVTPVESRDETNRENNSLEESTLIPYSSSESSV